MKNEVRWLLLMFMAAFVPWLIGAASCTGQTAPAIGLHANTPNVVALQGARVIVSPGVVLENAIIVIRDGLIDAVGKDIDIPGDAVKRDCTGKSVYPGLIDLHTHYGMPQSAPEIAGAGSRNWNDLVRPEHRAVDTFKPDDTTARTYRKNGFTATVTLPRPGIFRGEGALVLMTGEKPGDAILKEGIAQSLSLHESSGDYPGSMQGRMALIRQTLLDANWYREAWTAYRNEPEGQKAPDIDLALASLEQLIDGRMPAVFDAPDLLDLYRVAAITHEFNLTVMVRGSGAEYRRIEAVKKTGARLILPLDFPEAPDVSTDEVSLRELRHWDFAPENPSRLSKAGVDFALTTDGIENIDTFMKNLRTAVKRGLPADKALASLTTIPAGWLGMSNVIGTLEKGKIANFFITDGDLFEEKTKILDTWVQGKRYEVNAQPLVDIRGAWTVQLEPGDRIRQADFEISGEPDKPKTKVKVGDKSIDALQTELDKRLVMFAAATDSLGYQGVMRMTGFAEGQAITGRGTWADGAVFTWNAALREPFKAPPDTTKVKPVKMAEFPVVYPEGAFGRIVLPPQPDAILVKNAVLWTCGPKGVIEKGDLLVRKGKISEIGRNLRAPDNAVVIDAEGKHVTPGLLDAHSHLAIDGGVNEGTHSITSETRISDVIDPDNINIYRQLAGGLTTACIIHGSANTIGGQNAMIKLRWGALPDEMLVTDAPPGIKFALGENVKRSNVMGQVTRYPLSRMGVEEFIRDSFAAAKDYRHTWQEYEKEKKKRKNLIPPRRDLRLEPLVEVLDGKRQIQCHAYRQDEVLSLIRLGDEMGFKVGFFIHILEGYKVAEIMKKHGAMPSTFSDWWAYKFEVYDAIPYNGALMHDQGLLVSYNSDDIELARRMNLEAAKAVKYGDVPGEEALKFVTINPAIQLGIDKHVGSLEPGKDADFVIWSGSPLSTYSRCEQTWIDGRRYFDREEDLKLREEVRKERAALVQKILQKDK